MPRIARLVVHTGALLAPALAAVLLPAAAAAQAPAPLPPPQAPMVMTPALPPATVLEGFRQPIGGTLTIGYDDLGEAGGVFVDVREMRDTRGSRARGLVVEIAGAQALREQSFVDADEIPSLIKAIDELVAVRANPTQFRSFEIRYMTRGELGLTASSSRNRGIFYGVEVGRLVKARRALTAAEMQELRTLIETAALKLATLVAEK
jgi:hypothetical protein